MKLASDEPLTVSTIKAWWIVKRLKGRSQTTFVFTPICENVDFLLGMLDNRFQAWASNGVSYLCDLLEGPTLMSFRQLIGKYNLKLKLHLQPGTRWKRPLLPMCNIPVHRELPEQENLM